MLHQPNVFSPTGNLIPPSLQNGSPNRSQEEVISWWLMTLRAQTYCYILNDARTDPDRRFKCVFSNNCEKRIKGKGNLRRHIEWHLRRIEEEWKSNQAPSTTTTTQIDMKQPVRLQSKLLSHFNKQSLLRHPIVPMMASVPGFPLAHPL
jgi:hypothetical protein